MTVTSVPVPKIKREITPAYLGDLLANAGFIDQKQRAEVENTDKQWRSLLVSVQRQTQP